MTTEKMVKEYKLKMGTAPYLHVGYWSPPSKALAEHNPEAYSRALAATPPCCHYNCDHCGTPIEHHQIIRDSKGKLFAVGTTCIEKIGDHKLITAAKAAVNKKNREKAAAKREEARLARQAAYENNLEDQREKNGGLTDYEVARENAKKQTIAKTDEIKEAAEELIYILKEAAKRGDFARSILNELVYRGELPAVGGRAAEIVIEIIAKRGTRKGSKKYEAALPAAEKLFSDTAEAVKEINSKYPLAY